MEFSFVVPRIIKEFTYELNKLRLTKKLNIFDYPLPVREILYKYYSTLSNQYPKLLDTYSLLDLESDIIRDEELEFIPINVIDSDVIETKQFGKLLEPDYRIITKLKELTDEQLQSSNRLLQTLLSNNLNYIVHYKFGQSEYLQHEFTCKSQRISQALVNREFINVDLYSTIFGVCNVVNTLTRALDHLADQHVIDYIKQTESLDYDTITSIRYRFYDSKTLTYSDKLTLTPNEWLKFFRLAMPYSNALPRNLLTINIEQVDYETLLRFWQSVSLNSDVTNISSEFEDVIMQSINVDTYIGEWVKCDPKSRDYNSLHVDNETVRLNERGIKAKFEFKDINSVTYQLSNICMRFKDKLKNANILRILYKYNHDLLNKFEHTPEVVTVMLKLIQPNEYCKHFKHELSLSQVDFDECVDYIIKSVDILDEHDEMFANDINRLLQAFKLTVDDINMLAKHADKNVRHGLYKYIFEECYSLKGKFDKEVFTLIADFEQIAQNRSIIFYNLAYYVDEHEHVDIEYLRTCLNYKPYPNSTYDMCMKLINGAKLTDELLHIALETLDENQRHASVNEDLADLGIEYIKIYREEPPFELYGNPKHINDDGESNCSMYQKSCRGLPIPREMTEESFYNYFIESHGEKKNGDYTSCYTFFSNSQVNKIIFVKASEVIHAPAELRLEIPIMFSELKRFLHEELTTNGICMFESMTNDDWNKVTAGDNSIDCVVFSDSKNIYRERNTMSNIMHHIIDNIEIKFERKVSIVQGFE